LKKILKVKKFDLNSYDTYDQTALYIASKINDVKIVELLLLEGANVDIGKEENNDSPLSVAVRMGNLEIVKILLKHKAKIDDDTIAFACKYNYKEIVKLMLSNGFQITSSYFSEIAATEEISKLVQYFDTNIGPMSSLK